MGEYEVDEINRDGLGLRQRKKLERRHAIEAAALDLFERHGFEETTIGDIAAVVGISPRTFFYYFETKEDVVLADYARRQTRIIGELTGRPDDETPWTSLKASFLAVASDYETEREQLLRRGIIMATNPSVFARSLQLQAGWEDSLAHALTERMSTSEDVSTTPRLLAASALVAMRSSLRHWLKTGATDPLPRLVGECFDKLSSGLGAAR